MKSALLASTSAAALLVMSGSGLAQTAGSSSTADRDDTLEEIIVTATRRSLRLQDVPLSVTAYSQDELTAKGIVGYEGLGMETPGAVINRPTANFNNFSVRGIATNGYNANLQSTVAIYIDELPISANGNSTILDPNLYDVERVEFLRGPQGTLFGSGSLAGAVRILNKDPELSRFDASALVDFGQTGSDSLRQRYNAMVNVPLVEDELALRVVGFYRDEEGYLDNVGTGEHNSNTLEDRGGRAILLWEPTDELGIRFLTMYENSEPADSSLTSPRFGEEMRISDRPDQFHGELTTYNATVDYAFGGADLTSSSTWSTFDQSFVVDLAGTFGQAVAFALDAFAYDDIFVEEVRLVSNDDSRLNWVLGGFYYYKRRDVDYNYRSSPEYLATWNITGLDDEYYQRFGSHFVSHEKAVFGELTYNFTDEFWLTGGLRYGSTDVQAFTEPGGYTSNYLAVALGFMGGEVTVTEVPEAVGEKGTDDGPSYKISASYKPADSITTYVTYSTGFRTPVVNARAGSVSLVNPNDVVIPDGAESDKIRNYELGLKGNWFDSRLRANFAAYLIDWEDIQVQANRVSDQVQFATNIGAARSKGFEFEIAATPVDGLSIGLNGSFNDSEVTELTDAEAAISGAVEGARMAFPYFQGAAFVNYEFDVGAQSTGFLGVSVRRVGSFPSHFQYTPGSPGVVSPTFGYTDEYEYADLMMGAYIGEHLSVTGYVENLTDDHSVTYIHPEAFVDSRFGTLRPRTYGIRLGYDF